MLLNILLYCVSYHESKYFYYTSIGDETVDITNSQFLSLVCEHSQHSQHSVYITMHPIQKIIITIIPIILTICIIYIYILNPHSKSDKLHDFFTILFDVKYGDSVGKLLRPHSKSKKISDLSDNNAFFS